ncbi:MAG: hypothetical protein COB85_07380 [Bacteroidetes bacterium]|nr:MAG: hypothetical protein COB85_07380 [Bacteroidota bacterium]
MHAMNRNIFRLLIWLLLSVTFFTSTAQIGGNNTYESLNLITSARIAALGGNAISIKDDDVDLAWQNPSLLSPEMDNHFVLSFIDYIADIKYTSFVYSKTYKNVGSFAAGLNYLHYGTFQEADATGQITRSFTAQDFIINIGWGREILPSFKFATDKELDLDSSFFVGANLKFINSTYHFDYHSMGIALDLAGTYYNKKRNLTIAVLIKNIGYQLKPYRKQNREPLPFEWQLGISHKLKHAPFRLMANFNDLQKWDLTYEDPTATSSLFEPETEDTTSWQKFGTALKSGSDKFMRHTVIGVELIITRAMIIRFGYNYRRRKEMLIIGKKGFTGFSVGLGIKIKKFHISYARTGYHISGGSNHFTIRTDLSAFYTKKNKDVYPFIME